MGQLNDNRLYLLDTIMYPKYDILESNIWKFLAVK
jgi:hypothetical protein